MKDLLVEMIAWLALFAAGTAEMVAGLALGGSSTRVGGALLLTSLWFFGAASGWAAWRLFHRK